MTASTPLSRACALLHAAATHDSDPTAPSSTLARDRVVAAISICRSVPSTMLSQPDDTTTATSGAIEAAAAFRKLLLAAVRPRALLDVAFAPQADAVDQHAAMLSLSALSILASMCADTALLPSIAAAVTGAADCDLMASRASSIAVQTREDDSFLSSLAEALMVLSTLLRHGAWAMRDVTQNLCDSMAALLRSLRSIDAAQHAAILQHIHTDVCVCIETCSNCLRSVPAALFVELSYVFATCDDLTLATHLARVLHMCLEGSDGIQFETAADRSAAVEQVRLGISRIMQTSRDVREVYHAHQHALQLMHSMSHAHLTASDASSMPAHSWLSTDTAPAPRAPSTIAASKFVLAMAHLIAVDVKMALDHTLEYSHPHLSSISSPATHSATAAGTDPVAHMRTQCALWDGLLRSCIFVFLDVLDIIASSDCSPAATMTSGQLLSLRGLLGDVVEACTSFVCATTVVDTSSDPAVAAAGRAALTAAWRECAAPCIHHTRTLACAIMCADESIVMNGNEVFTVVSAWVSAAGTSDQDTSVWNAPVIEVALPLVHTLVQLQQDDATEDAARTWQPYLCALAAWIPRCTRAVTLLLSEGRASLASGSLSHSGDTVSQLQACTHALSVCAQLLQCVAAWAVTHQLRQAVAHDWLTAATCAQLAAVAPRAAAAAVHAHAHIPAYSVASALLACAHDVLALCTEAAHLGTCDPAEMASIARACAQTSTLELAAGMDADVASVITAARERMRKFDPAVSTVA